jgi:hypothetical protein
VPWGNPLQGTLLSKERAGERTRWREMTETQSSQDVSTKLERIAKRGVSLQTLAHHIDVNWLREAYGRTRKDGARGVWIRRDGVTMILEELSRRSRERAG